MVNNWFILFRQKLVNNDIKFHSNIFRYFFFLLSVCSSQFLFFYFSIGLSVDALSLALSRWICVRFHYIPFIYICSNNTNERRNKRVREGTFGKNEKKKKKKRRNTSTSVSLIRYSSRCRSPSFGLSI